MFFNVFKIFYFLLFLELHEEFSAHYVIVIGMIFGGELFVMVEAFISLRLLEKY